jgi:hypothetical protein
VRSFAQRAHAVGRIAGFVFWAWHGLVLRWRNEALLSQCNNSQRRRGCERLGYDNADLVYPGPVSSKRVPGGVVHKLPADLREALIDNSTALAAWKDITPLARNEFICWVEDAKQEMTRKRRIRRTQEELEEGQRRPCCWPGCKHRERTGR